jgi:hypothetical protein
MESSTRDGGRFGGNAPIRGSSCIGSAMRENVCLKRGMYFSTDTLFYLSRVYACVFCFRFETVKSTLHRINIFMRICNMFLFKCL